MTSALIGDVVGAVGAMTILAAYAYQTILGRPADLTYYFGNLLGATLLAVSLSINVNIASLALEAAWATIALYGIVKLVRERRR